MAIKSVHAVHASKHVPPTVHTKKNIEFAKIETLVCVGVCAAGSTVGPTKSLVERCCEMLRVCAVQSTVDFSGRPGRKRMCCVGIPQMSAF